MHKTGKLQKVEAFIFFVLACYVRSRENRMFESEKLTPTLYLCFLHQSVSFAGRDLVFS